MTPFPSALYILRETIQEVLIPKDRYLVFLLEVYLVNADQINRRLQEKGERKNYILYFKNNPKKMRKPSNLSNVLVNFSWFFADCSLHAEYIVAVILKNKRVKLSDELKHVMNLKEKRVLHFNIAVFGSIAFLKRKSTSIVLCFLETSASLPLEPGHCDCFLWISGIKLKDCGLRD